jgi:uncharacterized protein (UPF0261 family)
LLPTRGIEEWDRPGGAMHDPQGLAAFMDEIGMAAPPSATVHRVDAHINDEAFARAALGVLDGWVRDGLVAPGVAAKGAQEVAA